MREFYDRIGGFFTVFCVAGMVFLIVFAVALFAWGPPSRQERMDKLEDQVATLQQQVAQLEKR